MANGLVPKGAGTRSLVANANVSDEIRRAGIGFGNLVERTGAAVAATQNQLNETGSRTATALATTLVDVIAVQERIFRDDGTLDTSVSHTRQLPLITLIDPVFYRWSSVRLQGLFSAREFASETSSDSSRTDTASGSGQAGFLFIFGAGANRSTTRTTSTEQTTTRTQDTSFGLMRMNALLEPRDDVTIPKPTQSIRGPRLSLIPGAITDVLDGADVTGRTMSLLIQYNRRNGTPIAGKAIAVDTDGVPWSFAGGPTAVTDADGRVEITLARQFVGEAPDTTPADFIVSARIGLVQNTITVTF